MNEAQSTRDVLMIRPARFTGNTQTAASNRFQQNPLTAELDGLQAAALNEFEALVAALTAAGVRVHVFDDTCVPHTPDSIFPNNWVSFHADGTVVLYPLLAANRRLERRSDILEALGKDRGFRISRIVDLTHHESAGRYLEGTGSMVLDRVHRIAYASLSSRTDANVLREFARQMDYEPVIFAARDASGAPIYHTNVLLSLGSRFAAICTPALDDADRLAVIGRLRSTGHEILELSMPQLACFAGNMLELCGAHGAGVVALSTAARDALRPGQISLLERLGNRIVAAPIPTIERVGGGGVRCMFAEIHLPGGDAGSVRLPDRHDDGREGPA